MATTETRFYITGNDNIPKLSIKPVSSVMSSGVSPYKKNDHHIYRTFFLEPYVSAKAQVLRIVFSILIGIPLFFLIQRVLYLFIRTFFFEYSAIYKFPIILALFSIMSTYVVAIIFTVALSCWVYYLVKSVDGTKVKIDYRKSPVTLNIRDDLAQHLSRVSGKVLFNVYMKKIRSYDSGKTNTRTHEKYFKRT